MKKLFYLCVIVLFSNVLHAQGPWIDAGPDTLTCPPDCIELEATFEGTGATTDYTVETIPYAPDTPGGITRSLTDDSGVSDIAIGFDFCFYGSTYSTFSVSPNGWLGFGALSTMYGPVAIPDAGFSTPKNCIMGPWQDLNPGLGGTVTTQTLGVAPNRRLVVTWDDVPYFSCTGERGTQQIILYESTNIIENHITEKIICAGWVGGRAVQGIHNAAGTEAVAVAGRNNTVWDATNESVRYTPTGVPEIEWYDEAGVLVGTGAEFSACPDEPTTYTVRLISCDVEVASDEIFIDIECCDPPLTSFTPPTCFGDCDGTATAEGVGVAPFTYTWDAAAGGQTTPTATGLCAGTYEVTVVDAEGCTTVTPVTVEEPSEITGGATELLNISCFGLTDGSVNVLGAGGTGELTYDIGAGPQPTGVFTDLAAGTYTVTIEDANACTGEVIFEIEEPALLEFDLVSVNDVLCNGGADGEVVINGIGGTGVYEFQIDGGGYMPSGTFGGLAAGTYLFEVRDERGCWASMDVTVNEPTPLVLDIVSTINITCFEGNDGVIEVAGSGGFGALTYSIDGGEFVPSGLFDGLTAGTYTIELKDENDCSTTQTIELTEAPAVEVTEVLTHETCEYDCTGQIELIPEVGVAPYEFSIDGCATSSPSGLFTGLCAGDYDICVVDANGCEYTSTVTINLGAPPSSAVIYEFGRDFCVDDDPVPVSADSPGGVYTGPGMVGNIFNPGLAGVGTHTITYTISEGCGDIGHYTLTVHALPNISFFASDSSGCESHEVEFYYTGEAGIECFWNFGDGTSATVCGDVIHTYTDDDDYDVSLTVTTAANNCVATLTKTDFIEVYNQPIADFEFEPETTTELKTEIDFMDRSFGPETWEWIFDTEGSSTEQNPSFFFPRDVADIYDVTLMVSNADGCADTITKSVKIAEEYMIYVPNTITPDGDTYNEVFKPYFRGIDIYNYSLRIYNRWGELLFESYDPSKGWDGTYGGEVVQTGVYIWHISTDEIETDRKIEHQGHVTVLR